MLPSESGSTWSWEHLPEAEPPARLRAAVLLGWGRAHGNRPGRMAGVAAVLAVAALFVLAVTLPLRVQESSAVDPAALALLRAQGLEVAASPTAAPPEVRHVASGSPAARLGLRPGDRLLSVDLPIHANGMMNVAVLRGDSPRYFALPGFARRGAPDAGMASSPARAGAVPGVAVATPPHRTTSLLQSWLEWSVA